MITRLAPVCLLRSRQATALPSYGRDAVDAPSVPQQIRTGV
ncbi:hypothetical protein [Streptomyces prunicolor]|uniref:Uncharacterized protein n=1 Tax=Streptomyces prunicolor TaxID=67348 RepID=A0ABU4FEK9_9ACTN|nr:hypothetical protein [Streptomyces prunicolor]MDV7219033.1 hypothetical protein [Streptomyces prunicolor]